MSSKNRPKKPGADAAVAIAAAEAGAAIVRAAYGRTQTRHAKTGSDFATQADLDAEQAILGVIRAHRPDDGFIGEETGHDPGTTGRLWLVDPLCGTVNFAATTPLVAVNVALLDHEHCLASVTADPIAGDTWWSDGDQVHSRRDGVDQVVLASGTSRLIDINCDGPLDSVFVGPQLITDAAFRAAFGPRVMSTSLALAWAAVGRRAGYVTDGSSLTRSVHFAAGIALCRASGCVVTDLIGAPVEAGRGLIAAADRAVHEHLIEFVARHLANERA